MILPDYILPGGKLFLPSRLDVNFSPTRRSVSHPLPHFYSLYRILTLIMPYLTAGIKSQNMLSMLKNFINSNAVQLIYFYYVFYFSTVFPFSSCVFLFCKPFVIITTFSAGNRRNFNNQQGLLRMSC